MATIVINWKTSLVGFALIGTGFAGHYVGLNSIIVGAIITTGLGFVATRDA